MENKPEKSEIAKREEEVLQFWQENKIFEKSLAKESPKGEFVFYEGPPTANGKPGIHHLIARAFKDVITRYKTMQGYHVRRKGGWDTHGLPVELQVEKQLGLKSKKEIEEYGIEAFNKKCKESVWEYLDIWNKFTKRIGYWVDQENPYVTYDNSYIEAVWSVLKKVDEQNLVYKDYKVVPWCPRCGTALSSHELAQGYQDDKDLSVTIKFHLLPGQKFGENKEFVTGENAYILAWTTTPWTLPGNVALAVGKDIDYSVWEVKDLDSQKNDFYILATNRSNEVLHEELIEKSGQITEPISDRGGINKQYKLLGRIKGLHLIGLKYKPLFPYLKEKFEAKDPESFKRAYQVYSADFVNTEDGTGIVHTAVMYGQDDFVLGTEVGLPKYHLVGEDGNFVPGTGFLEGRFVKEMDEKGKPTVAVEIIEDLKKEDLKKGKINLFFAQENIKHSYPHCWRCKTALIYYARDSWYIKMSSLREKLVKENELINWVPGHIKEGRFGEWLREIKDWAISRERYWGTPLPIWQSKEGAKKMLGSLAELKKYTKKSGNQYWTMRHGEAEQNKGDFINSDPKNIFHLTGEGRERVKIAAPDLKSKKIDLIIHSPFTRCQETAEIVRQTLGLDEGIMVVDERLSEFKKGPNFEGKKWDEYWKLFANMKERFEKKPDQGENLLDLNKRLGEFIYDIENKYTGKNILIVSHDGPIASLNMVALGSTIKESIDLKERGVFKSNFAEINKLEFVPLPHNENYELDLHKPYIDQVVLVAEDGSELKRTKEVMDVWFDSGAMPFAQDGLLGQKQFLYPADYISEAIDQTRGWFYTLHAIGILMGRGKAYKNVICLGHILDAEGKKMSKSLGNIVDPWLMMDKYGVDPLRLWMFSVNQPGDSKNFDEKTVDEIVKKVINPIENIISFYFLYKDELIKQKDSSKNILDIWIINRFNDLVKNGTNHLNNFQVFESARLIRDFVNDFSTWYLRRSRDRFKSDDFLEKSQAIATTHFILMELAKYLAPFMPMLAESIFKRIKFVEDPISVHLCQFPLGGEVDREVLENMQIVRDLVSVALEKRMSAGIKVRQPLGKLKVKSEKLKNKEEYLGLIKDEVNVKEIVFDGGLVGEVELDTEITPELQNEGKVRDLVRAIQDLRKIKNLMPAEKVVLVAVTDSAGQQFLEQNKELIQKPTNVKEIIFELNSGNEVVVQDLKFNLEIR